MNTQTPNALAAYLLAMADDELLLGHRNSEWCGHAPILEEDIAFANLALDEMGHASLWYTLLAELSGNDPKTYPDQLAFFRQAEQYRNVQMVELPRGDWAFSIVRQYLFDAFEQVHLEALKGSRYAPLAEAAAKIYQEELYHYRHASAWMRRLALGTEESHQRVQRALDALWPYAAQLFVTTADQIALAQAGYVPAAGDLESRWKEKVTSFVQECALTLPHTPPLTSPRHQHTPHLKVLLAEMQSVARLEPGATW